ncbi:hypothetical protein DQ04_24031010, partial [Trypanosoma grayi]|uniref:hypothetical protein n=1 Tax=Trypanosoma grayi TaxID=71804 RepID=UPI0004F48C4D
MCRCRAAVMSTLSRWPPFAACWCTASQAPHSRSCAPPTADPPARQWRCGTRSSPAAYTCGGRSTCSCFRRAATRRTAWSGTSPPPPSLRAAGTAWADASVVVVVTATTTTTT